MEYKSSCLRYICLGKMCVKVSLFFVFKKHEISTFGLNSWQNLRASWLYSSLLFIFLHLDFHSNKKKYKRFLFWLLLNLPKISILFCRQTFNAFGNLKFFRLKFGTILRRVSDNQQTVQVYTYFIEFLLQVRESYREPNLSLCF